MRLIVGLSDTVIVLVLEKLALELLDADCVILGDIDTDCVRVSDADDPVDRLLVPESDVLPLNETLTDAEVLAVIVNVDAAVLLKLLDAVALLVVD